MTVEFQSTINATLAVPEDHSRRRPSREQFGRAPSTYQSGLGQAPRDQTKKSPHSFSEQGFLVFLLQAGF